MKSIIAGIDPGTTTAYAVLDTKGNIISVNSKKEFSLDNIVKEIISYGNVILVGTDKRKCPGLIEKFKARVRCKLILPKQDMTLKEKKEITKITKVKNDHEMDALAAAMMAYKEHKNMFIKVENILKEKRKEEYSEKVKAMLIENEGINVNIALDILTEPEKPEVKAIVKVIEKKEITEKDYLDLYRRLKVSQRENQILKEHNKKLSIKENMFQKILNKTKKINPKKHIKKELITKEHNINILAKEVQKRERTIKELKEEIKELNEFISEVPEHILIKKLDNLGFEEYKNKNKTLNIKEGDVIMVDDFDRISEKTLKEIKKIKAIIIDKDKKIPNFITIKKNDLKIKETKHFGLVNKKEFEKEMNKKDILNKIIKEYQNQR